MLGIRGVWPQETRAFLKNSEGFLWKTVFFKNGEAHPWLVDRIPHLCIDHNSKNREYLRHVQQDMQNFSYLLEPKCYLVERGVCIFHGRRFFLMEG